MQEIVYHTNYKLENEYWWFVARQYIISDLINKYSGLKPGDTVLDAGCGTGGFAEFISSKFNILCLDTSATALEYCRKRGLNNLFNCTLDQFPKDNWNVKGVFMLDVVEHIEDDEAVVGQVYDLLPKGGCFVASVPAFRWLWSKHDDIHMHKRRYTKPEFLSLLERHGFRIEYSSYFNTFLFLPAVVARFVEKLLKKEKETPVDEVSPFVNKIFTEVFKSERNFLTGMSFPFGLSIIAIARKD
jgi:SAM-dependent methyltransferase